MKFARAVFLDRDGVLNRAQVGEDGIPRPPRSLDELEILPGVEDACRELKALGFRLIVVTNQPDVARGMQTREAVFAMNQVLTRALSLDDIRVCFHDDVDGCECRKPKPGLILEAALTWHVDPTRSYMVGDRWRDIEAGQRAGCVTILVNHGHPGPSSVEAAQEVESLMSAARWIRQRHVIPVGGQR